MQPIPQTSVPRLLGLDEPARETLLRVTPKEQQRDLSVKIAGFGGHGVLLLGEILAEMGMREGREVSWLPSYGPEMRSGSAHCHVCIANGRVGSPLVEHPDVLIAMNEISLHKFGPHNSPGSSILFNAEELPTELNSHLATIFCIPASSIADDLGSAKVTNMVMLGALLELTRILLRETSFDLLTEKFGHTALLELDIRAIDAGIAHMRKLLDDSENGKNQGRKERTIRVRVDCPARHQ